LIAFVFLTLSTLLSVRLLKNFIFLLIEDVSSAIKGEDLVNAMNEIEEVKEINYLRVWCAPVGRHCMAAKVTAKVKNTPSSSYNVLRRIRKVAETFNIHHSLVEVSPETAEPVKTIGDN